jgi:hypothetical protein
MNSQKIVSENMQRERGGKVGFLFRKARRQPDAQLLPVDVIDPQFADFASPKAVTISRQEDPLVPLVFDYREQPLAFVGG